MLSIPADGLRVICFPWTTGSRSPDLRARRRRPSCADFESRSGTGIAARARSRPRGPTIAYRLRRVDHQGDQPIERYVRTQAMQMNSIATRPVPWAAPRVRRETRWRWRTGILLPSSTCFRILSIHGVLESIPDDEYSQEQVEGPSTVDDSAGCARARAGRCPEARV